MCLHVYIHMQVCSLRSHRRNWQRTFQKVGAVGQVWIVVQGPHCPGWGIGQFRLRFMNASLHFSCACQQGLGRAAATVRARRRRAAVAVRVGVGVVVAVAVTATVTARPTTRALRGRWLHLASHCTSFSSLTSRGRKLAGRTSGISTSPRAWCVAFTVNTPTLSLPPPPTLLYQRCALPRPVLSMLHVHAFVWRLRR